MKKPSKLKLGFDFVFAGFMLGASLCLQPYDFGNIFTLGLGLIWLAGAAATLDKDFY